MRYLTVAMLLILAGCDSTKNVEEFDSRVEYCKQHGATYKTYVNGFNAVFVYCLKDDLEFDSKTYEGVEK